MEFDCPMHFCRISNVLLQRKILVASKRLDKGSGQEDLDLFLKGELVLVEGEKDNISVPSNSSIDKKVTFLFRLFDADFSTLFSLACFITIVHHPVGFSGSSCILCLQNICFFFCYFSSHIRIVFSTEISLFIFAMLFFFVPLFLSKYYSVLLFFLSFYDDHSSLLLCLFHSLFLKFILFSEICNCFR